MDHDWEGKHSQAASAAVMGESPQSELPEDLPPVICGYRLVRLIGTGTSGQVFLARQRDPRRHVALKILRPKRHHRDTSWRFFRERQILSKFTHDYIAPIYEGGEDQGFPFFAMAYVAGTPLTRFCQKQALDLEARLRLFHQVCEGMAHVHRKGVAHCDLKPANILVELRDGKPIPRIIDFGLARMVRTQQPQDSELLSIAGGPPRLMGTPAYMSPEQTFLGLERPDCRADVHALGLILYELLTGVNPFAAAGSMRETFNKVRHHQPPGPVLPRREGGKRMRRDLSLVTMKALAKQAGERYEDASRLSDEIARILEGRAVAARPSSPWKIDFFSRT